MMKPGYPVHICVDSGIEEVGASVLLELWKELENLQDSMAFC